VNDMEMVRDFCAEEERPGPQELAAVRAKVMTGFGGAPPGRARRLARPRLARPRLAHPRLAHPRLAHSRLAHSRLALAGAVAVATAAAVTAALVVPSGARPAQSGRAQSGRATLAAWIIARDPDGGITIDFNQMKNLAGMQATLRADGVPARVTFNAADELTDPLPRGCSAPHMSSIENGGLQRKILTPPAIYAWLQRVRGEFQHEVIHFRSPPAKGGFLSPPAKGSGGIISGPRMPAWLQKIAEREEENPNGTTAFYIYPPAIPAGIGVYIGVDAQSPTGFNFGEDLVVTSPQCTGS
jgi:hypothetical protein